jgi:hypothetical protein
MDDQRIGETKKLPRDVIERVEPAEARFRIELSGVAAFYEVGYVTTTLTVKGEVSSEESTEVTLEIAVLAYDLSGDVIGVGSQLLRANQFPGIAGFEVETYDVISEPARVKVFPAARG